MTARIVIYLLTFTFVSPFFCLAQDKFSDHEKLYLATQPGMEHEQLFYMVGKWRQISEEFHTQSPPTYGKGEADTKIILGGRYVQTRSVINYEGYTIEQYWFFGYDKVLKNYTFTVFDNVSTVILHSTGSYDPDKRRFEFSGESPDILEPEKMIPFRVRITFESDRKYIFELFLKLEGEEIKRYKIVNVKLGE